ncbi:MAG TPA: hypothetical protein VI916_08550 [Acidimicrobiia bacterium]|nr:hypothetical protein [Acidimicrobiia bacterium]
MFGEVFENGERDVDSQRGRDEAVGFSRRDLGRDERTSFSSPNLDDALVISIPGVGLRVERARIDDQRHGLRALFGVATSRRRANSPASLPYSDPVLPFFNILWNGL